MKKQKPKGKKGVVISKKASQQMRDGYSKRGK